MVMKEFHAESVICETNSKGNDDLPSAKVIIAAQ
jgi:hypothetical protein